MPSCIVCGYITSHKFEKNSLDIFYCSYCGLGFVFPIPPKEELRNLYLKANYYNSSGGYGYNFLGYHELELGLKIMYRSFLKKIPKQSYSRILDIGCANAYFSDVAKETYNPREIYNLDITSEAEQASQEKGYSFIKGFIEDVTLDEKSFDLIFMGDCFEHLFDPIGVVKKLERVLAPNGILILTTVDFNSLFAKLFGCRWRLLSPPEHLYFWTPKSLKLIFERVGFEGEISNYWLRYPKTYTLQRFKEQFGFSLPFFSKLPIQNIPVWSFDVMLGIFKK